MPLKCGIILFLFFCEINYTLSQDIHFTQFTQSPIFLNPALTGNFDGDLRAAVNFKNQWSAIPVPYNSGSMSVDFNFLNDMYIHGNCGAGIMAFMDEAGDSRFRTIGVMGSFAFNKFVGRKYKSVLSIGFNVGYVYKGINTNSLRWDEQFNGDFYDPKINPTDPNNLVRNNLHNLDLGLGVNYSTPFSKGSYFTIGGALQHINNAPQTFYAVKGEVLLQKKPIAYTNFQFRLSKKSFIKPELFYQWQDDKQEFVISLQYKHVFKEKINDKLALVTGMYFRAGDAFAPNLRLEVNQWTIGLTYDFNSSELSRISSSQGGIELSIIYIQKYRKKKYPFNFCPFLWM